ncbi:MAG: GNAT family N-acetyltransferase [Candidatus Krumholzibacteriota bacterium]|nr:GNAT family N-acetyltransferase [Candidatus Krumholzibacteriota bacterium]
MTVILHADTPERIEAARSLFREYAGSLGFSLEFQDFERELDLLPGEYAPPGGVLFLAEMENEAAGCVALRRIDPATCEMKRLYVRPASRGQGIGRALAAAAVAEGRELGYRTMKLDTVESMPEANALYRSLGFVETGAYRFNPLHDARFFECELLPK